MAAKKTKSEDTVRMLIPYVEGEETDIIVGINGKNWQIQRGKPVDVPLAVAKIIANSDAQKMYVDEQKRALSSQDLSNE